MKPKYSIGWRWVEIVPGIRLAVYYGLRHYIRGPGYRTGPWKKGGSYLS